MDATERRGDVPRIHGLINSLLVVVVVLGVAAAVCGGVMTLLLRTSNAAGNAALVDSDTTEALTRTIGTTVEKSFSYSYADLDAARTDAHRMLTGDAVAEYDKFFTQARRQAQAQRLVLQTSVRAIGVKWLRGDSARLLVFVDQQKLRTDDNQRTAAAAGMDITAARVGGHWKITGISFR